MVYNQVEIDKGSNMVARILVGIGLVVLAAGFIFFAGNVIYLGTKEFFKIYGPKSKKPSSK